MAFEAAQKAETPSLKKPISAQALSFSFVSLDAPSGFTLSSGTNSSEDIRIKPNANSYQSFQELMQAKGLPSPSPLVRNLHFGAFGAEGENAFQVQLPHPVCDHDQQGMFLEEPKWKEDDLMTEAGPDNKCGCAHEEQNQHGFFGIYDAHGGSICAEYVHEHLHGNVTSRPSFKFDPEMAFWEGIQQTERDFLELATRENWDGNMGTCLCSALIFGNQLLVANVGDSSAILCRNGQHVRLSYPHTLQNISERERIESIGGSAKEGKLCHPFGNQPMSCPITRSIGDSYFKMEDSLKGKPCGLIAEPEIAKITLTPDDEFLFLASSGYWDVVSPKETIALVKQLGDLSPSDCCKELTNLALKRAGHSVTTLLINLAKNV